MPTHSLIGRDLGNYTVVSLLGEGGMGAVFEGRHRFLGDRVAIKVLHGTYANNQQVSQRFFQEAKSARDIGHPGIIKVLDFGQSDDGSLYLVMELLDGRSLGAVVADGPIGEEDAAKITAAASEALAAAHEKGVIHRDLKPDNIFIVGDTVKILDFGIAKVVTSAANTGTGALLGTPKYMAPEQARGAKGVGPNTDVYALGVILFQMLTGQLPFEGTDIAEILVKILMDPPPAPSSLKEMSPEMEALILACLSKDPAGRPDGMIDLRNRLGRWVGPPSAMPIRVSMTAPTISLSKMPATRPSTTLSSSVGEARVATPSGAGSRRRAALFGIAAAAAIGIGAGAVVLIKKPATVPVTSPTAAPSAAPVEPVKHPMAPAAAAAPAAAVNPTVVLRTEPRGAQIFVDGKSMGTTPKLLELSIPHEVSFQLDGYVDAHEVLTTAGEKLVTLTRKPVRAVRPAPSQKPTLIEPPAKPATKRPSLDD